MNKWAVHLESSILDIREKEFIEGFKSYLSVEKNFSEHTLNAYCSDIVRYILWLNG